MALTDKSKRVNFILSCQGASSADLDKLKTDINTALNNMGAVLFAYILHDRDVKEDGTIKTPHFHIVAEFPSSKRLSTFLNLLSGELCCNPLSISVEKCRSFEGSFQYLVHKNDSDKFQYSPADISCNFNEDTFQMFMCAEAEELTIDRLIYLCRTYKKPILVAQQIGLGRYQIYRKVIDDIFKYLYEERLRERKERLTKLGDIQYGGK